MTKRETTDRNIIPRTRQPTNCGQSARDWRNRAVSLQHLQLVIRIFVATRYMPIAYLSTNRISNHFRLA